jgi:hypothetical protein
MRMLANWGCLLRDAPFFLPLFIHPSAWKVNSANFTRCKLPIDGTASLAERGGIRTPDAVSSA